MSDQPAAPADEAEQVNPEAVEAYGDPTSTAARAVSRRVPDRGRRPAQLFGEQVIHEGLDLKVRRGEILGVVGGSGTGKSVLMRSIIGLQTPDEGSIDVFGRSITDGDPERGGRRAQPLGRAVPGRRAVFHPDRGRERRSAAQAVLPRHLDPT